VGRPGELPPPVEALSGRLSESGGKHHPRRLLLMERILMLFRVPDCDESHQVMSRIDPEAEQGKARAAPTFEALVDQITLRCSRQCRPPSSRVTVGECIIGGSELPGGDSTARGRLAAR
jgi:hypothetical protein